MTGEIGDLIRVTLRDFYPSQRKLAELINVGWCNTNINSDFLFKRVII